MSGAALRCRVFRRLTNIDYQEPLLVHFAMAIDNVYADISSLVRSSLPRARVRKSEVRLVTLYS